MKDNLWNSIVENVKPLKKKVKMFGREIKPVSVKKKITDFEISFLSFEDIKPKKERNVIEKELSLNDVSRIDSSMLKKIKKRKFNVNASLDLHGKTLDVAFNKFVNFINSNYDVGNRYLLIVTGKGNPSKNTGVIKNNLPLWIKHASVNSKILYASSALIEDGGDGAFYIFLRKKFL